MRPKNVINSIVCNLVNIIDAISDFIIFLALTSTAKGSYCTYIVFGRRVIEDMS